VYPSIVTFSSQTGIMAFAMPASEEESTAPNPPCGLYLHIPFCAAKCGYCDFYSVAVKERDTLAVISGIERELRARLDANPRGVGTVFCGGGTPTILPARRLGGLLETLSQVVPIDELAELSVEANPGTVDEEKAKLLVAAGVNRVSMGAQSFVSGELATLDRLHAPDDTVGSVALLRREGVRQINLDLIFGIPGQTLDTWSESLRRAIELEPDHVACYGLTYEPGTRLLERRQNGQVTPCDERLEADMYLHAIDTLASAGYEQYETSNFARPGCQCLHNLIYWRNGPYIGVGPSAAGYLDGRRYKNVADVDEYVRLLDSQGHAEAESEVIDAQMLVTEMIMMQLRLVEGLSVAMFRERTGVDPLTLFSDVLNRLTGQGFITVSDTHIALTRQGRLVSDAIMAELVCHCPERILSSPPWVVASPSRNR
jgi:oxygen-independent coproporphyrinogen-3 oxidase